MCKGEPLPLLREPCSPVSLSCDLGLFLKDNSMADTHGHPEFSDGIDFVRVRTKVIADRVDRMDRVIANQATSIATLNSQVAQLSKALKVRALSTA